MTTQVSFQRDIAPIFAPYRPAMLWRLDLTKHDDMMRNAEAVYAQIHSLDGPPNMPPQPYPPLTDEQVALFKAWMEQGFAP